MTLSEGRNYTVRRVRFPNKGNAAAVIDNSDGTYTIFLNTQFDKSALDDALRHELRHLEADDFNSALPISVLEARAGSVELPRRAGNLVPFFASEAALADWILCQKVTKVLQI